MARMRDALKEELTDRFPWLFDDLGFHLAKHDFSSKAIGSSFAVIESDVLRVGFEMTGGTSPWRSRLLRNLSGG